MLINTKGIVLRTIKYGESSLICDILTEEKGLVSYIVGGVRKSRSRNQASLFLPLSIIELVGYYTDRQKLHRLKEVKTAYIFQSIPFKVKKGSICLFIAELCSKCIKGSEYNPELFTYIESSIISLDQDEDAYLNLHLHFMLGFAELLGFGIQELNGHKPEFFDMLTGSLVNSRPDHAYYSSHAGLMNRLLDPGQKADFSRMERNILLDDLLLFFKLHLEDLPAIHSHEVLRQVL